MVPPSNFFIDISYGHSFVLDNGFLYTYMFNSLWSFEANLYGNSNFLPISSEQAPVSNLFNYGLATTEERKLILFGGLTEDSAVRSIKARNFTSYSELWMYDLKNLKSSFIPIIWKSKGRGFSKLLSLGGELVCLLNSNLPNQIVILDISQMIS
jgi:hypothetical protein